MSLRQAPNLPNFNSTLIKIILCSVIVLTGIILYADTLDSPFRFDDYPYILKDHAIRMTEPSWSAVTYAATNGLPKRRPIPNLSFALNYYIDDYAPAGYHLLNITVHILTGLMLFFFLAATFRHYAPFNKGQSGSDSALTGPYLLAFFSALLWLVIPIHTQSVTYVVQRMTSMAALFYIMCLWLYVAGRMAWQQSPGGKKKAVGLFILCGLAGLFAFGSKEHTATLPIVILLYEGFFFQNLSFRISKRQLAGLVLAGAVFTGLVFYLTGGDPLHRIFMSYSSRDFTLPERVMTEWRVVIYYIGLLFYPASGRLILDHNYPLSGAVFDPATTWISFLAIVALIVWSLRSARRERLAAFCVLWFFITLAIESSLIGIEIIYEHRTYLPAMMICPLLVITMFRFIRPKWFALICLVGVITLLSAWTYQRNQLWQTDIAFWRDCAQKSPMDARVQNNLGLALLRQQGAPGKAAAQFKKATQLDPFYAPALNNWGRALMAQDQLNQAISRFKASLRVDPGYYWAHACLGEAFQEQGKPRKAIEHYKKALEISPAYNTAHYQLARAFIEVGENDKAMQILKYLLRENPRNKIPHNDIAGIKISKKNYRGAIRHLKKVLQSNPYHIEANIHMGDALAQLNQIDDAMAHYRTALRAAPDNAMVHRKLGEILLRKNRFSRAKMHFETALRLNPDDTAAKSRLEKIKARQSKVLSPDDHFRRGLAYQKKGKTEKAIAAYQTALEQNPSHGEALFQLAILYAKISAHEQAIQTFKRLGHLQPRNPKIDYNIACMYARQNNETDALNWLKKAVEKGYDNWRHLQTDDDLAGIKDTEYVQKLLKRNNTGGD